LRRTHHDATPLVKGRLRRRTALRRRQGGALRGRPMQGPQPAPTMGYRATAHGGSAAVTRRQGSFKAYLAPLHRTKWFVYCKRPFAGPEQVLMCLFAKQSATYKRPLIRRVPYSPRFRSLAAFGRRPWCPLTGPRWPASETHHISRLPRYKKVIPSRAAARHQACGSASAPWRSTAALHGTASPLCCRPVWLGPR
jgi:hypothetical protein